MSEAYFIGIDSVCPTVQYEKRQLQNGQNITLKKIDFQIKKLHPSDPQIRESYKKSVFQQQLPSNVNRFKYVKSGQKFGCIIDHFNSLWMWGCGTDGQLGLEEMVHHQKVPVNFSEINTKYFSTIECGTNFVLGITEDNKQLYAWGDGQFNKLGKPYEGNCQKPMNILQERLFPAVKQFNNIINNNSKLERHTTKRNSMIRQNSQLYQSQYTTGQNSPHQKSKYSQNERSLDLQNIFVGQNHSYVQMNNFILTFGKDKHGRMGLGNDEDMMYPPTIMPHLSDLYIKGISVGKMHCIAWDIEGQTYSWGCGIDGKLGHPMEEGETEFKLFELKPRKIKQLQHENIIDGIASNNQSIVLTKKGRLWTWGDCSEGCLGHEEKIDLIEPKVVKDYDHLKVVDVSCGDKFTLILTVDRKSNFISDKCRQFVKNMEDQIRFQCGTENTKHNNSIQDSINGDQQNIQLKRQKSSNHQNSQNKEEEAIKYMKNKIIYDEKGSYTQGYKEWFEMHYDSANKNSSIQNYNYNENSNLKQQSSFQKFASSSQQFAENQSITQTQQKYGSQINFILGKDNFSNNNSQIVENIPKQNSKFNLNLKQLDQEQSTLIFNMQTSQRNQAYQEEQDSQIIGNTERQLLNSMNGYDQINSNNSYQKANKNQKLLRNSSSLPSIDLKKPKPLQILQKYNQKQFLQLPNINKIKEDVAVIQISPVVDEIFDLELVKPSCRKIEDKTNKKVEFDPSLIESNYQFYQEQYSNNFEEGMTIQPSYEQVYEKMGKISRNLTSILKGDNDIIKYEYIELVKNGLEDSHLNYLMQNPQERGDYTKDQIKLILSNQSETEIEQKKISKIVEDARNISYVQDLPSRSSIKNQIKKFENQQSKGIMGQKDLKKIRKMMKKRTNSPTVNQKIARIAENSRIRDEKIIQALKYKEEMFIKKQKEVQDIQIKRSKEYRDQLVNNRIQKQEKIKKLKPIIYMGNLHMAASILKSLAINQLTRKQQMLKFNLKASIIQKKVRKWLMHLKVINNLSPSVKDFFTKVILNFVIRKKIERKQQAVRRIRLHFFQEKFKKRVKVHLIQYIKNIKNCQRFFIWCEKYMNYQVNILKNQWDTNVVSQHGQNPIFKIQDTIWQKDIQKALSLKLEIQKKNQKGKSQLDFPDKINLIPSFMPTQYDTKSANFNQVKIAKKQGQSAFTSPANQSQNNFNQQNKKKKQIQFNIQLQQQKEEEQEQNQENQEIQCNLEKKLQVLNQELDIQEGMLPFTKHIQKLNCNQFRIKFAPDYLHREVINKVILREQLAKEKFIKNNIIHQRKKHRQSMENYKKVLIDFIEKYQKEIQLERAKLLLKTDVNQLRDIYKREDLERKKLEHAEQQQNMLNKNKGQLIENSTLKYLKDHLPFGSQIMMIADRLYYEKLDYLNEKNQKHKMMSKPSFRLKIDNKQFEEGIKIIYDDILHYYNRCIKEEEQRQRKKKKESKGNDKKNEQKQALN